MRLRRIALDEGQLSHIWQTQIRAGRIPVATRGDRPALRWASELDGNHSSTRQKLLAGLSWVQAGAATAAALGTFVDVETIGGFAQQLRCWA